MAFTPTQQAYNDQLRGKYSKWVNEPPEDYAPYSPDTAIADVNAQPTVGGKILTGLGDALKYLNTGAGQKLSALAFKDPYKREALVAQGEQTGDEEFMREAMLRKAYESKMGSAGEYLGKQSELEAEDIRQQNLFGQQSKLAEIEAEQRAQREAEAAKQAKELEIQKLSEKGAFTPEQQEQLRGGGVAAPVNKAWSMLPFTRKWKVTGGETPSFNSVDELNKAKLPKGTRVRVGGQLGEVE